MIDFDKYQGFIDHLFDRGANQVVSSYDGNRIELAVSRDPNQMQIVQPQLGSLQILGNKPATPPQLPAPQPAPKSTMTNAERDAQQAGRLKAILVKTREMITRMHDTQDADEVARITPKQLKQALLEDGIVSSNIHRDIGIMQEDGPNFCLEFFILYNLSEDPEFVLNYTQEAFKNRLATSMRIAGRHNDRATAAILLEEMRKLALPGGHQQFQNPNA